MPRNSEKHILLKVNILTLMIVLLPLSVGWRPFTDARFYLPAHLWFLYYLLVYCAAAALVVSRFGSTKFPAAFLR